MVSSSRISMMRTPKRLSSRNWKPWLAVRNFSQPISSYLRWQPVKLTNSTKTGIGWGGLAAALLLFVVLFILFLIEHYTGVNTIPHCIAVQQPQTNICWLVGFFPSSHLYPYAKIIYFSLPLYPIQVYDD